MEIEVELTRIIINEASDQQVIVLKDRGGPRSFPIVIGMPEILAIDRKLKGLELPRPMTHDLLGSVIKNMGGELERVVINDLNNHTFYAKLYIKSADGEVVIDSRPSDALALSAGLEVPVFVDEQVFEKMQQ